MSIRFINVIKVTRRPAACTRGSSGVEDLSGCKHFNNKLALPESVAVSASGAQQRKWYNVSSGVRSSSKSVGKHRSNCRKRRNMGPAFEDFFLSWLRNETIVSSCVIEWFIRSLWVSVRSWRRDRRCSTSAVKDATWECRAASACWVERSCSCDCSSCLWASETAFSRLSTEEKSVMRDTHSCIASRWGKSTCTAESETSGRIWGGIASGQKQFAVGESAVTETLQVAGGGNQICFRERLKGRSRQLIFCSRTLPSSWKSFVTRYWRSSTRKTWSLTATEWIRPELVNTGNDCWGGWKKLK